MNGIGILGVTHAGDKVAYDSCSLGFNYWNSTIGTQRCTGCGHEIFLSSLGCVRLFSVGNSLCKDFFNIKQQDLNSKKQSLDFFPHGFLCTVCCAGILWNCRCWEHCTCQLNVEVLLKAEMCYFVYFLSFGVLVHVPSPSIIDSQHPLLFCKRRTSLQNKNSWCCCL